MRTFDPLLASLREGRFLHAYMLVGPKGCGKKELALQMADALTGAKEGHPDLIQLAPQGTYIGVDHIRELQEVIHAKPREASVRIVLVEEAHCMNERAQNAFLKTLEEPEATVFILLCDKEASMLPTIRSRCMVLRMSLRSREDIVKRLLNRGVDEGKAALAAALSRGSWGDALAWAADEERLTLRLKTIEGVRRLFSRKTEDRLAFSSFLKENKENIQLVLDVMLSLFRDMALAGKEGRMNLDCGEMCDRGRQYFTQGQIVSMMHRLMKAQTEFGTNVNYGLAVDALLIDLMKDGSEL